jgi:prepilin-type N-terminal cleavage/methylation domain-containing protein
MKKGFTLIELLVVTSIITFLSLIVLLNYRAGESQFALQRSANKLAQDIRRAEEMAVSAKVFAEEIPAVYGIYCKRNNSPSCLLFADKDGQKDYDDGEKIEDLELEKGIEFDSFSPGPSLTILFIPPDPTVYISYISDEGDSATSTSAAISIKAKESGLPSKTIKVNSAGLITIE